MQSLAELKRRLKPGTRVKLVASFLGFAHKYLDADRVSPPLAVFNDKIIKLFKWAKGWEATK